MTGSKKRWYAVYTRTGYEKRVSEFLTRRNIESYYPLNKILDSNNSRKKITYEPLFSSYVFVRIDENEVFKLKNIAGVINFIYWLDKPAVIEDAEIAAIKVVLNEYTNIKLEKIGREPVIKHQRPVLSINNTFKIMLSSLGYALVAEIKMINEKALVRTIEAQNDLLYPVYASK